MSQTKSHISYLASIEKLIKTLLAKTQRREVNWGKLHFPDSNFFKGKVDGICVRIGSHVIQVIKDAEEQFHDTRHLYRITVNKGEDVLTEHRENDQLLEQLYYMGRRQVYGVHNVLKDLVGSLEEASGVIGEPHTDESEAPIVPPSPHNPEVAPVVKQQKTGGDVTFSIDANEIDRETDIDVVTAAPRRAVKRPRSINDVESILPVFDVNETGHKLCPECGSSMKKRLGMRTSKCIQEKCPNYWKR